MGSLRETFGKRVREIRKRREITQKKLGEMLKVHNSYIHQIEVGKVAFSAESLARFAEVLNVRPYELIMGEEDQIFMWNGRTYNSLTDFIFHYIEDKDKQIDKLHRIIASRI